MNTSVNGALGRPLHCFSIGMGAKGRGSTSSRRTCKTPTGTLRCQHGMRSGRLAMPGVLGWRWGTGGLGGRHHTRCEPAGSCAHLMMSHMLLRLLFRKLIASEGKHELSTRCMLMEGEKLKITKLTKTLTPLKKIILSRNLHQNAAFGPTMGLQPAGARPISS